MYARADPRTLPALHVYYRQHPADFINDWGIGQRQLELPV
jgi:hypothetical protein